MEIEKTGANIYSFHGLTLGKLMGIHHALTAYLEAANEQGTDSPVKRDVKEFLDMALKSIVEDESVEKVGLSE